MTAPLWGVAALLGALLAVAEGRVLRHGTLGLPRQSFVVDLSSMSVVPETSAGTAPAGVALLLAADERTRAGGELACLSCDPALFEAWVASPAGRVAQASAAGAAHAEGPKHPNAPGYDKWEKASRPSFLASG